MYTLFKEEKRYGLKDDEDNIIIPAEYEEIATVPNYFDLLFNTFQVIYRLRKNISSKEFIYFQPRDPESNAEGVFSPPVAAKVYYFYKNYSLLDYSGDIERLCVDGTIDEIVEPSETVDTNDFYGLVRCDHIVKKSGKYDLIDWDTEITENESGDLVGYELSLNSLPGYLGFSLHKEEGENSYLYSEDLIPSSSEFNIGLGWPSQFRNGYIGDYTSLKYKYISKFDICGLATVQDSVTNRKAYINRYFIQVTDWFDHEVGDFQLKWHSLFCNDLERYVIKDNRLIKLKLAGDFISDMLINTYKFFESYKLAKSFLNLPNRKVVPEKSVYFKIDRDLAIRTLVNEGKLVTEENIQNTYDEIGFVDKLKSHYDYFLDCTKYLEQKKEVDFEYIIDLHHQEFGVIPSYSYVHSDFGLIAEGEVDFFRGH